MRFPRLTHRRVCGFCLGLYVGFLLGVWILLAFAGDRWWFATFLLFGPRWLYGLPLIIFVPWVAWLNRRMLLGVALCVLILLGPLMGLCIPWRNFFSNLRPDLRILTCNIDGENHDPERFEQMMRKVLPDVVLMQESPEEFMKKSPSLKGWHSECEGELLIASRFPLKRMAITQSDVHALYCLVETPEGEVGVCNIHPTTPREGLSLLLDRWTIVNPDRSQTLEFDILRRSLESKALLAWVQTLPNPKIIAGDFNMPTDSAIYASYWSGYGNAFSEAGFGFGYSKWTPVGPFLYGLRIDHILSSAEIRPYRAFLGDDVGSDHLPMIADFDQHKMQTTKPAADNSPR